MLEEYRRFNEEIEVSNLGNVKRNGEIMPQYKDEYYYNVTIDGKPVRVHTLVGKLFPDICGEFHKYYHYHHLNRNQLDNRAENIKCLSPSEHRKLHQLEDGVSVPVKAYDLQGNKVGEWDSQTQAAKATGQSDHSHIKAIIKGEERRFTAAKLYWFKKDTPEEVVKKTIEEYQKKPNQRYRKEFPEEILKQQEKLNSKKICQKDEFGNLVKIWNNIDEITEYYGVTKNCIVSNIKGKTKFFKKELYKGKKYTFERFLA